MMLWPDIIDLSRNGNKAPDKRVEKTRGEWEKLLAPEVFRITRLSGTERPFSSEMCSRFEPGTYACACCETVLFDGSEKFDSGTGWPSFTEPINKSRIIEKKDYKLIV